MKTERRHELQTNALADWLGDQIDKVRPYSRIAVGIVLALIVVAGLYSYLARQTVQRTDQGWQRYFQAVDAMRTGTNDAEPLAQLAQSSEFANTSVGYWATLTLADHHLAEGLRELFNDRAAAVAALRSAGTEYTQVANQVQFPMLAERAMLGVAQSYESLNELDKARREYEALLSKPGSGAYTAIAQQRLQDLGQEPTKRFYDWFFATTPLRQGFGGPGLPGLPTNLGNLPDERAFKSPASDSAPETPAAAQAVPAADGAQPPGEEYPSAAPADAAPAAEKPAETPAAEKPAGEKPAETAPGGETATPEAKTPGQQF